MEILFTSTTVLRRHIGSFQRNTRWLRARVASTSLHCGRQKEKLHSGKLNDSLLSKLITPLRC